MPLAKTASQLQQHVYTIEAPTLRVEAPAKINLYLAVTGARPDGYHDLATIFERITLADTLEFTLQEHAITCTCDQPGVPSDARNLAVRAARLLQERYQVSSGVHITLTKRIPTAAGLGGGSSDAAATLRALNTLWKLDLSTETLMQLGRELGADIPFFLMTEPFAFGVGRGDVLLPIPVGELSLWHVLVSPSMQLPTPEVFRVWDTLGSSAGVANVAHLAQLMNALLSGERAAVGNLMWNQLMPAAVRIAPLVQDAEDVLATCGADAVSLSGSGPTMIATMSTEDAAHGVAARVRAARPGWWVAVTRTDEPLRLVGE